MLFTCRTSRGAGRGSIRCEAMERRVFLTAALGTNLIVNPGAEANVGSATGNDLIVPAGWTVGDGSPTVVQYGASGFPATTDPGPSSRGKNFFAGGPDVATSDLFQTVDLSNLASSVDANKVTYTLDGFLGGFSSQDDNATVFINFQNSAKGFVSQTSIGPVLSAARNGQTGLLERKTAGTIPATTRFAQIQIHFERSAGAYNDGYADNLSLVLASTANLPATLSGTVFNDLNGDGLKSTGEVGLGGVKVFLDANNNGKQDSTDPVATTLSNGSYRFAGVPLGKHNVYVIAPSSYRVSGPDPISVTSVSGAAATANFFVSQTAVISGVVFNDVNGNKIQDAGETGISGVVVYLDFNNNGQLDSFELKSTTDSKGHYQFVVPFGTYVVRQVLPAGKIQTTPTSGFTLTLAKGSVSSVNNFGDR